MNRIVSGVYASTIFTSYFSTYSSGPSNTQASLVATTNTSLATALFNTLGGLGAGESYLINSASLLAGSASDDYAVASNAYEITASFDNTTLTWDNCGTGAGCVSGTDYSSTIAATGSVSGSSTSWDLTSEVASALSLSQDFNFFLAPFGGDESGTYTTTNYVSWAIDAEKVSAAVPEPSVIALFGLGLVGVGFAHRRMTK